MVQLWQLAFSLQVAESAGVTWQACASHTEGSRIHFFTQSTAQPTHSNKYDKKQLIIRTDIFQ